MAYDPYRNFVTALLNFDGTSGTAVFPDATGKVWTAEGNIILSDAKTPYPGNVCSALFDGNGDGLYFANSSGALISYQTPYTIESRVYITGNGATNRGSGLWGQTYNGGTGDQGLVIQADGTVIIQRAAAVNGGSNQTTSTVAGVASSNAWHHVAETYDGTTIRVFIDGVPQIAVTSSRGWNLTTQPLRVGRVLVPNYSSYRSDLQGYMAGFRITNGVARWVDTFEPQSGPYSLNGLMISGFVRKGDPASPTKRTIILLRQLGPTIVGTGESDPDTGSYEIETDAGVGDSLLGMVYPDYGEPPIRSHVYTVGDYTWVGEPAPLGHWYECEQAGTTGSTEPTWPTDGSTVTDGTVIWRDKGVMERPWAEGPYIAEAL